MGRCLSGAAIPGQSGPGSNGNEGVPRLRQSSRITGTSPSDCLVSYLGHLLGGLTSVQSCSRCIQQPQPTGQTIFELWKLSLCAAHVNQCNNRRKNEGKKKKIMIDMIL